MSRAYNFSRDLSLFSEKIVTASNSHMLNTRSMKFQSEDLKRLYFMLPFFFFLEGPFKHVPDLSQNPSVSVNRGKRIEITSLRCWGSSRTGYNKVYF